mmetsp:Transcript_38302/g.99826  ORF Transcript_38302/g.99826 Transcript_38302/m.99826 type:complete len:366 (+) Transcript_38302:152-1249(+)
MASARSCQAASTSRGRSGGTVRPPHVTENYAEVPVHTKPRLPRPPPNGGLRPTLRLGTRRAKSFGPPLPRNIQSRGRWGRGGRPRRATGNHARMADAARGPDCPSLHSAPRQSARAPALRHGAALPKGRRSWPSLALAVVVVAAEFRLALLAVVGQARSARPEEAQSQRAQRREGGGAADQGHAEAADVHRGRHPAQEGVVHVGGIPQTSGRHLAEGPRLVRERRVALAAEQQLGHQGGLHGSQHPLVQQVQQPCEGATLAQPVQRGGVREPAVALALDLTGLPHDVVDHVHWQLEVPLHLVVELDGGTPVRAQADHHAHGQHQHQPPQGIHEARLVRWGSPVAARGGGQAVGDNREDHPLPPRH